MGYSNEGNDDDDDGNDDDREPDEGTEEKNVVPDTGEGLKDRFDHLFIKLAKEKLAREKLAREKLAREKLAREKLAREKLAREKQYEHGHELTVLLDAMLVTPI